MRDPESVLEAYEEEINLHEFDLLIPLISSEAVFIFSDGTFRGHAELRRAFEDTWSRIANEEYWLENLVWQTRSETVATSIYTYCWQGICDGKLTSGRGRGTTVLRKEASGWVIVHEHLSREPHDS